MTRYPSDPADAALSLNSAVNHNSSVANDVASFLRRRAAALEDLGLSPHLAEEMRYIAGMVVEAAAQVSAAYGLKLTSDLRNSEAMAGSLLQAALLGAIGPKETASRKKS